MIDRTYRPAPRPPSIRGEPIMEKLPKFVAASVLAAAIPAGVVAASGPAWAGGMDVTWSQTFGSVTAHIFAAPPVSAPQRWCTYTATPSTTHVPISVPFLFDPRMTYDLTLPGIPSPGATTSWDVEITCDNSAGGGDFGYVGGTYY
ncbi:MAG: hypothetical protein U0R77_02390 [Mycolicibacterium insubricum]